MKISELENRLKKFKKKFGDVPIIVGPQLTGGATLACVCVGEKHGAYYLILGDEVVLHASMQSGKVTPV